MPAWKIAVFVGLVIVVDLAVVSSVMAGMLGSTWWALQKRFPGTPPAPGAVRRNFQSLRMDFMNLGLGAHLAADESYLHLLPTAALRWFRCRPISVPWEEIRLEQSGRRWASARIGKLRLAGPAWALGLAAAGDAPGRG